VTPLFLDRPYVDTERNPGLEGLRVVRLPRHLRFDVELRVSEPAALVRFLSDENDNRAFANWERADDLRVNVPGRGCALTRAVRRRMAPGFAQLPAGGPCSASPLLVSTEGDVSARTVHSWNKLVRPTRGGWSEFVVGNARKLAGLALAYLVYCWLLGRRARR